MIQSILLYALQAVFFLISLVLYVLLTACILPHWLLGFHFSAADIKDRGVKKYLFADGRAIVYLPDPAIRTYIPQYILSDHQGERFLECMLNPTICSLRYRVLPFDAQDRPLPVLEVEDPVSTRGISKILPLPLNTAYVTIFLLDVNGKEFKNSLLNYSLIKLAAYGISTIVLTILEALMIKQCLLYFADLMFAYSDMVASGYFFTVFTAAIVGALYALIVLITHFIKGSRIRK